MGMFGPSYFIEFTWLEFAELKDNSSTNRLPGGMTYEDLCLADADTKRLYYWNVIRKAKWELKYGIPTTVLLIGNKDDTSNLIHKLKIKVKDKGGDMEFRHMSMHDLVVNDNMPIPAPQGSDGGFLIVNYQSGLTDLSIYDLTKNILMQPNTEESSTFAQMDVDVNWNTERNNEIMPWVRTGWNLIVIADEDYYNRDFDCSIGFESKIYRDLSSKNKWREVRAFDIVGK